MAKDLLAQLRLTFHKKKKKNQNNFSNSACIIETESWIKEEKENNLKDVVDFFGALERGKFFLTLKTVFLSLYTNVYWDASGKWKQHSLTKLNIIKDSIPKHGEFDLNHRPHLFNSCTLIENRLMKN